MTDARVEVGQSEATSQSKTWLFAAGLALATVFCLADLPHRFVPGDAFRAMVAREPFYWAFAAILIVWLTQVERQPLAAIGLRWAGWRTLPLGIAAGIVLVALLVANSVIVVPLFGLDMSQVVAARAKIVSQPYWFRIAIVVRAALVEEILYRGFLIEHVRQLTGSTALAVIVSAGFFTYAHLSAWGWVQLIPVGAAGVVFALLYVWKRNLPANMIGHFIADGVGFLV